MSTLFGESIQANQIHDNHIQGSSLGFEIVALGSDSSIVGNQIYDNHIHDITQEGILISVGSNNSIDANKVIYNHIIRSGSAAPGFAAIALKKSGALNISLADNVITYNFAEHPQSELVYCDDAPGDNFWQINFIDLVPEIGTPLECP